MSLNKTIIIKTREKTENNSSLRNFLIKLLEFEIEGHGWYKSKYNDLLEDACKEAESANSKN